MTISATILTDSVSQWDQRLTTFQLRYPRFIHAEELTHRVLSTSPEMIETVMVPDGVMYDRNLSRNASSSRAIPVSRMIAEVRAEPAMPVFWGKNQKGMQAQEELSEDDKVRAKAVWLASAKRAVSVAGWFAQLGAHKQIVNRVLEPYCHINVVVTATEWDNFYALRRHPDAQPEIRALADAMWEAQQASTPKMLRAGQWHLPYITQADWDAQEEGLEGGIQDHRLAALLMAKVSAARCARVSYRLHDGSNAKLSADLDLADKLMASGHWSPFEHQATPDAARGVQMEGPVWGYKHQHRNFRAWRQFRAMIDGAS